MNIIKRLFNKNYTSKKFWKNFSQKITFFYDVLSTNKPETKPILLQPVLFVGTGNIEIGKNTNFGVDCSFHLLNTYGFVAAYSKESFVKIGNNVHINNGCAIVSGGKKGGISIGNNCLIGVNFKCFNSDFHSLNPNNRDENIKYDDVVIGDNVFIGNDVTILKGVVIGNGCTIGAGSVVTKSFPENCVIGGNPAKIIKRLEI